jgi:pilus assembly protein Flp/PilA
MRRSQPGDEGATATEYVLLIAGIAAVVVLSIFAYGRFLNGTYNSTCDSISIGISNSAACN